MENTIKIGTNNYTSSVKEVTSSNGTVHKYFRTKITVGHDPTTGRQIQKEFTAPTIEELEKKINSDLHVNHNLTPDNTKLKDWLMKWYNSIKYAMKPTTQASYLAIIEKFLIPSLGEIKVNKLTTFQIQNMVNTSLERGLNPRTVKSHLRLLSQSLNPAVHQRILLYNPCEDVKLPRNWHYEVLPLCDEDISHLLEESERNIYGNLFAVLLFSGMRISEALGLSWDDVDFDNEKISIRQQLLNAPIHEPHKWETALQPYTKTNRPRVITPPSLCFDYIRREKLKQKRYNEIYPGQWSNPDNLVFTIWNGRHLQHSDVRRKYKILAHNINRPETRIHDLRHTAASVKYALSGDIRMVQQLLGHSTIAMSMWYTHVTTTAMYNLAEKENEFYQNIIL